jgi:hypothetical protein
LDSSSLKATSMSANSVYTEDGRVES